MDERQVSGGSISTVNGGDVGGFRRVRIGIIDSQVRTFVSDVGFDRRADIAFVLCHLSSQLHERHTTDNFLNKTQNKLSSSS